MLLRPPRSTLFPTRRSSDLTHRVDRAREVAVQLAEVGDPRIRGQVGPQIGHPLRGRDRVVVASELHLRIDRKSTRLNSRHRTRSYAVFCTTKQSTPT